MGSGAKSYIRKDFLIYCIGKCAPYMRRPLVILYMSLHPIPHNFLIYRKILFSFLSMYSDYSGMEGLPGSLPPTVGCQRALCS